MTNNDPTRKIPPVDPTVPYRAAPLSEPKIIDGAPALTRPGILPRRSPWAQRLVALLGGGLGLGLGVILALAIVLVWFFSSDLIFPGVQVMGADLGGYTRAEAETILSQSWSQRRIILVGQQTAVTLSPGELGLRLDTADTVEQAHRQGRTGAGLKAWLTRRKTNVWPIWHIDLPVAAQTLTRQANQFAAPPVEAGVTLANGQAQGSPGANGWALDIPATVSALEQNALQAVMSERLDVALSPVAPQFADVSAAVAQANALLAHPLKMRAYDPVKNEAIEWAVGPEIWGNWLAVGIDPVGNLTWQVQSDLINAQTLAPAELLGAERYLKPEEVTPAVAAAITGQTWSANLRPHYQPRRHVVQPGQTLSSIGYDYGIPYPWLQQANPGADNLFAGQTITIPPADALLPLPVIENKRIVVSISRQQVWVYENGAVIWNWPVSTGIDDSPTSPGIFQVQTHYENAYAANWDLWMPYFMGIYRPVPNNDFMNGFHGFPTRGGSQLLWTGNLGTRVTYGCILIHSDNAQLLYNWAEEGVVVEIQK